MKRRSFIKRAGAAAATGSAFAACNPDNAGSGPAIQTSPSIRWRLASSFPRSLDTIFGAADVLADRVEKLTDGRFQIRPYPSGELVPGLQVLDAVQQGTVQIGHTAGYYYIGKNPSLAFDCTLPFGLSARQQNAWLYQGGGSELMNEAYSDFNIMAFPGGNTGVQMGGWFRSQIDSLSDLNGLKMRIPGLGGRVMDRLGANVQNIAAAEIYQALERGTIDAAEWVGPYDDEKLSFNKVAQYYMYPGWWEPGPTLSFLVNMDEWAKLPEFYQEVLKIAASDANMTMIASYDAKNPDALDRLVKGGTILHPFSDEILEAAHRESFDIFEGLASEDAGYRKIYTNWKDFRQKSYNWFAANEQGFGEFAYSRGA